MQRLQEIFPCYANDPISQPTSLFCGLLTSEVFSTLTGQVPVTILATV